MSVLDRLDDAIKALSDVRDELATVQDAPAADTLEPDAPPEAEQPAAEPVEGEHDNTLPFKCPGCGQTYPEQVECTNGHPAIETKPTDTVIAATDATVDENVPADAAGSDASSDSSSQTTRSDPSGRPTWPA